MQVVGATHECDTKCVQYFKIYSAVCNTAGKRVKNKNIRMSDKKDMLMLSVPITTHSRGGVNKAALQQHRLVLLYHYSLPQQQQRVHSQTGTASTPALRHPRNAAKKSRPKP